MCLLERISNISHNNNELVIKKRIVYPGCLISQEKRQESPVAVSQCMNNNNKLQTDSYPLSMNQFGGATNVYPFLETRKKRGPPLTTKIMGSVFFMALPYTAMFAMFYLLWAAFNLQFLGVTTPFTVNSFYVTSIVVGVTLLLFAKFTRSESKYLESWKQFRNAIAWIESFAQQYVSALRTSQRLGSRNQTLDIGKVSKVDILLRCLPYVIKHDLRNNTDIDQLRVLTPELKDELRSFASNISDSVSPQKSASRKEMEDENVYNAINSYIQQDLTSLMSDSLISRQQEALFRQFVENWKSAVVQIGHILHIDYPSQYTTMMKFFLYFYLMVVATFYLATFGFLVGLFCYIFYVFFFVGLDVVGGIVENPFAAPENNPYIYRMSAGEIAHGCAKDVSYHFAQIYRSASVEMMVNGQLK